MICVCKRRSCDLKKEGKQGNICFKMLIIVLGRFVREISLRSLLFATTIPLATYTYTVPCSPSLTYTSYCCCH